MLNQGQFFFEIIDIDEGRKQRFERPNERERRGND